MGFECSWFEPEASKNMGPFLVLIRVREEKNQMRKNTSDHNRIAFIIRLRCNALHFSFPFPLSCSFPSLHPPRGKEQIRNTTEWFLSLLLLATPFGFPFLAIPRTDHVEEVITLQQDVKISLHRSHVRSNTLRFFPSLFMFFTGTEQERNDTPPRHHGFALFKTRFVPTHFTFIVLAFCRGGDEWIIT